MTFNGIPLNRYCLARDRGGEEQAERSNGWTVVPSRTVALNTVKEGKRDHSILVVKNGVTLAFFFFS